MSLVVATAADERGAHALRIVPVGESTGPMNQAVQADGQHPAGRGMETGVQAEDAGSRAGTMMAPKQEKAGAKTV